MVDVERLKFDAFIWTMAICVLPWYFVGQVLTGNWSPRRVDLKKFWRAAIR